MWLRIVGAVVGVFIGFFLFIVLDGAADVLPGWTGWVQEEAGLWAAAIVTLAVAWWRLGRAG
jgi:hypothetical protein